MGFRTDLLTGLAQHAAAAGLGVWNASGVYTSGQTAIVLSTMPANPDRVISLAGYSVEDDPSSSTSVEGVQVSTRWGGQDPRPVEDLADSIFNAWQNLGPVTLPTGVRLVSLYRRSSVPAGQDTNSRWSRIDNYYATVWRPTAHRI